MSKNKNTTDEPINTTAIRRLQSFDPTIPKNYTMLKQPFISSGSDTQEELELSGDDKRPNLSCCELV